MRSQINLRVICYIIPFCQRTASDFSIRFTVSVPVKRERKNKRFSYTRSQYHKIFFTFFTICLYISEKKLFMKQFFPLFSPFFRIFWPFLLTFFTPKIILLEVFLRFVAKSRLFYPYFLLIHFSVGMTIFASSLDKKLLAVFSTDFHPQKLQYLYIQYF